MSERKYDQKRLNWVGKLVGRKVGSIELDSVLRLLVARSPFLVHPEILPIHQPDSQTGDSAKIL